MIWVTQIFRSFFFSLDSALLNFIPQVYDFLMTISRTSILTQGQIKLVADRIQVFLGVFMLFKVTFSLITYIIMPDEFSDKSKGFGKLWQNIIISLVLLILTPYAFNMAYDFQSMILEDNSLATLVFGDYGDNQNYLSTTGDIVAYSIIEPFFSPNMSINNLYLCSNMVYESNGTKVFNTDCRDALLDLVSTNTTSSTLIDNYVAGAENSNIGLFFRLDIAKATVAGDKNGGTQTFLIDYLAPLSTVVAVVVLLLLITFCLDVALRSVKLAFLQLISPIPIIAYIDPKGKDGIFKKWYQMCFSTYLSLFIRLLALYLGIYIIGKVNGMTDIVTGASVTNMYVKILITIGVLMFAKQLPKILEGLGIKLEGDGKFQLNPLKKFEDEAFGGKQIVDTGKKAIGGAKGLATGAAIGAVGAATGAGIGRAFAGAFGGMTAGISGKKVGEIRKDQVAKNTAMRSALLKGSTFGGRMSERVSDFVGSGGEMAHIESEKHRIQGLIDSEKNEKERIEAAIAPARQRIADHKRFADSVKAMEDRAKSEMQNGNGGTIGTELLKRKAIYERLKTEGSSARFRDASTGRIFTGDDAIAAAEASMNHWLNDEGLKQYMTEASLHTGNFAGTNNDATFDNLRLTAEQNGRTVHETLPTDGDRMHRMMGAQKGIVSNLERSIYDQEQQIATHDTNIQGHNDAMRGLTPQETIAQANRDAIK